jgi:hypothetical protein
LAKLQEQFEKVLGQEDGDLVLMTNSRDKLGMLTPNDTTPYLVGLLNLERTDPLVIEYLKGPTAGDILDFWQQPISLLGFECSRQGRRWQIPGCAAAKLCQAPEGGQGVGRCPLEERHSLGG